MASAGNHYFPAINSLRAIAVLMVLFHHYIPENISGFISLGNLGVDIFFVISGFLITGIIISYKGKDSLPNTLKIFYIRRALRIFPLYYLYIIIAALWLRHDDAINKHQLLAAFLYFNNFYVICNGWGHFALNHFWSLAVEEQFYLFWPLLILLAPQRFFKALMIFMILFSIGYSLSNTFYFHVQFVEYIHLISCMQALALGGLLAVLYKFNIETLTVIRKYSTILFLVFLTGWAACLTWQNVSGVFTFMRTFNSLLAFIILTKLIMPGTKGAGKGIFLRIMNLPSLQFIGRISYGIYVYHILVKVVLERKVYVGHMWFFEHPINMAVIDAMVTIAVAYISFRFFESPINRLKDRFTLSR